MRSSRTALITARCSTSAAVATFILCASPTSSAQPTDAERQRAAATVDDLQVVHCSLPGEILQLGGAMTYIGPRRPTRTTALDCKVAGGEYVSGDLASPETSLKVWLAEAKAGDAEAQYYVGRIYDKDMQAHADAATWYARASEQGYARATQALGALYEKGLGVPRDPVRAINLYRAATGLDEALDYASNIALAREEAAARVAEMSQQLDALNHETRTLRLELAEARSLLARRHDQLAASQQALDVLRRQLEREPHAADPAAEAKRRDLEAEVRRQKQEIALFERALKDAREEFDTHAVAAEERSLRLQEALARQTEEHRSVRARLATREQQLIQARAQIDLLQGQYAEAESRLSQDLRALEQRTETTGAESASAIAALRAEVAARSGELERARERIRLLERDAGDLSSEIETLRAQHAGELESLQAREHGLHRELTETRAKLEATESALTAARLAQWQQLEHVREQGRALEALRAAQPDYEELARREQELARARATTADQRGTIERLENEIADLRTQLQAMHDTGGPGPSIQVRYPNIEFGNYYALVIGNERYARMPHVGLARHNAGLVADVLDRKYRFQVEYLEDLDRNAMARAIESYRGRLDKQDNLLIFYAGRGTISENGQAFWMGTDAEPDMQSTWLAVSLITDLIDQMPAKHVFVIADSVFAPPPDDDAEIVVVRSGDSVEAQEKTLRRWSMMKTRMVMCSNQAAPVPSPDAQGHSIFTRPLIQVLERNQAVLNGAALFLQIATKVGDTSKTPLFDAIDAADHRNGQFLFVPRQPILAAADLG